MSSVAHALRAFGVTTPADDLLHDRDEAATNLYVAALDLANATASLRQVEMRNEKRDTLPAGEVAWIDIERPRAYARFSDAQFTAGIAASDYKEAKGISPEESEEVYQRHVSALLPPQ